MVTNVLKFLALAGWLAVAMMAWKASALSYTIPNTFTAGTTAQASQVNANFTAAKTAIDDIETRVVAIEGTAADVKSIGMGPTAGDGGQPCTSGDCFDGSNVGNKLGVPADFIIQLDADNTGTNSFRVQSGTGAIVMSVNELGNFSAIGTGSILGQLTLGSQAVARGTMVFWGGDATLSNLWSYTFGAPTVGGANVSFFLPPTNGSSGYVLQTNGSGVTSWLDIATQIANAVAAKSTAAVTTDNTLPRFDGAAGDIQPSLVVVDDSDNLSTPGTISSGDPGDGTRGFDVRTNTSTIGAPATSGQCRIGFVGTELYKMCQGGVLTALEPSVVVTTTGSLTIQAIGEMEVADHATPTSNVTYTLPDAVAGMSACFYDNGGGSGRIVIDPNASEVIILDGTAQAGGQTITSSAGGANGDTICLLAIDATTWISQNRVGTWVSP